MNNHTHNNSRAAFSRVILKTLTAIILLASTASVAAAQNQPTPSTDRDNAAQLTSNVITGDGVDSKTEYFYSFTAGPGEVKLTLDVKAEKSAAVSSVDIALFDANSSKVLSTYANPDHGSNKRAVETIKVRGEQTVLLDVTISQGVDNFKIKLEGAVKIAPSTSGVAASSATDGGVQSANSASQSQTGDGSTVGSSTASVTQDASTSNTSTVSQDASVSQPNNAASASQTGAAGGGLPGKAGKVNAKVNSGTSVLSSIISAGSSTANSVKSVKKKKQQQ